MKAYDQSVPLLPTEQGVGTALRIYATRLGIVVAAVVLSAVLCLIVLAFHARNFTAVGVIVTVLVTGVLVGIAVKRHRRSITLALTSIGTESAGNQLEDEIVRAIAECLSSAKTPMSAQVVDEALKRVGRKLGPDQQARFARLIGCALANIESSTIEDLPSWCIAVRHCVDANDAGLPEPERASSGSPLSG